MPHAAGQVKIWRISEINIFSVNANSISRSAQYIVLTLFTVVDVYQAWCGHTVGMMGTLRKFKMEHGDKLLKYAIVSYRRIDCLRA